jgi:crotonobetainyl-CoA:carnitine CoA-transferase CaiB-like acyl-CoA transferase
MITGTRVLDLSRVLAGPLCTMMLGDLGADVIKVERPDGGDETRSWGPPFDARGESAYYLSINRNKLSVAADLDASADRELIERLITGADVVVDNFRPGTLERRGLDPARFLAARDDLIWCTITGFGIHSARPGYDFVVQAERGWMAITGEESGAPMKVGVALADVIAGKDAAIAILAALAGRGSAPASDRRIVISLADSAAAALINVAQNVLVSGHDARRWGNAHANLVPYQLFDAADRPIVIAVGSDAQWRACVRALGAPLSALADDEQLATNAGRLAHRGRVVAAIAAHVRGRPALDWIAALDRAGVPCGLVKSVPEALAAVESSALTGVAPSVPGTVRLPPPRLDEHGASVRALGWAAFGDASGGP